MTGALLDTNALYRVVNGVGLRPEALVAIGDAQAARNLLISPISAWELALASKKPPHKNPTQLDGVGAASWFRNAKLALGAAIVPVRQRVAMLAARVATECNHGDPGDCFLIASAVARMVPLTTSDSVIAKIAARHPFFSVVRC